MARYLNLIVRVDDSQFGRSMSRMSTEAEAAAKRQEAAFRRSQSVIYGTASVVQSVGRAMTRVGVGMLGVGYVGVKASMNFQTAMTRIQTQAGLSASHVDALGKAVLNLGASGQVQYGPTQLADALYHIESYTAGTGYKGLEKTSNAMKALQVAAKGAALGGSDLSATTTALMGVMFATRSPASQLQHIMGQINATVGAGNMTMSQLVTALGRSLIPAFQQAGLKASDAMAAVALFADSGVPASSAAAQISTALHYLIKPSAQADKMLRALHMTSITMATDIHKPKGMLVALKDLKSHLDQYAGGLNSVAAGQVLATIFPQGRGRIMDTVLQNLDRYGGKLGAIYDIGNKLTASEKAQGQTIGGKLHKAWSQIQTDLVRFGNTLTPIVAKDLPVFTSALNTLFKLFNAIPGPIKAVFVPLAIGLAVGGPVLMGLGKMIWFLGKVRDLWKSIRVFAAGAAIAEGAAGATGAAGAAGGAAGAAGAAAGASRLTGAARAAEINAGIRTGSATAAVGTESASTLGRVASIGARAAAVLGAAVPFIDVGTIAYMLAASGAGGPLAAGQHPVGYGMGGRAGALGGVGNLGTHGARGGIVTPYGIRHMSGGGPIGSDNIMAWLSAGEGVVSRIGMSGLGAAGLSRLNSGDTGGGSGLTITPAPVTIILDGRVVARAVLRQTLNRAARGSSSLVGGSLSTGAVVPTG